MNLVLEYIWVLPVAVGIAGVYVFAMQDLRGGSTSCTTETED